LTDAVLVVILFLSVSGSVISGIVVVGGLMQAQRKLSMRERIILFVAIIGLAMIVAALVYGLGSGEGENRLAARDLRATANALDQRATEIAVAATRLAPAMLPDRLETPAPPSSGADTPNSPATSRQTPVPVGQTWPTSDGLVIRVLEVDFDAWQRVMAENRFNDPPAEGMRMVMVGVEVTNATDNTVTPRRVDSSDYRIVGDRGIIYTPFESNTRCGVIPNELDQEIFADATVTGNVCVVAPQDEEQLQLIYKAGYAWDDQVVYFALTP